MKNTINDTDLQKHLNKAYREWLDLDPKSDIL